VQAILDALSWALSALDDWMTAAVQDGTMLWICAGVVLAYFLLVYRREQ
jgi:hypothetical protein